MLCKALCSTNQKKKEKAGGIERKYKRVFVFFLCILCACVHLWGLSCFFVVKTYRFVTSGFIFVKLMVKFGINTIDQSVL